MEFLFGIVQSVDTNTKTYSFVSLPDATRRVHAVSYSSTDARETGADDIPAPHSFVIIALVDEKTAFHIKTVSPPFDQISEDNFVKTRDNAQEPISNKTLAGEYVRVTKDGSRVALLRGGVASFGASDFAQLLFFASENLVRLISQNKEEFSDSGRTQDINDDGQTNIRAVVTDNDLDTYKAANDIEKYPEHFPFQYDIGNKGDFITLFIGEVVDAIRQNRLVMNVKKDGTINIKIGSKLHEGKPTYEFYLENDKCGFRITKEDGTEIYKKELKILSSGRVDVQEFNEGNYYEKTYKGSRFLDIDHRYEVRADIFVSFKSLITKMISRMIDMVGTHKNTQTVHEAGLSQDYFTDKPQE